MAYQTYSKIYAALLWIMLALAIYLAADSLIGWNLACWDELEPATGQSACAWDDVEVLRWTTR